MTEFEMMQKVPKIFLSYSDKIPMKDRPHVSDVAEAYRLLYENWPPHEIGLRESFKVILLNIANRALGIVTIGEGGIAGVTADPKMIFASAILSNASGIILAHNHPSGNLQPSQKDKVLTKKVISVAKELDLKVQDHIIITPNDGYFSFANENLI